LVETDRQLRDTVLMAMSASRQRESAIVRAGMRSLNIEVLTEPADEEGAVRVTLVGMTDQRQELWRVGPRRCFGIGSLQEHGTSVRAAVALLAAIAVERQLTGAKELKSAIAEWSSPAGSRRRALDLRQRPTPKTSSEITSAP
jgi:hypothetical protein